MVELLLIRRPLISLALACLVLLLVATPGTVEAAPRNEQEAVDLLLAELGAGQMPSEDRLDRLRDTPGTDAWIIVEYLLARGRHDLAKRFAARTALQRIGPLDIYAAGASDTEAIAAQLRVLEAGHAAEDEGAIEEALRLLAPLAAPGARKSVFAVLGGTLRGNLVSAMPRRAEGIDLWLHAARDALHIGWWASAERLIDAAIKQGMKGSEFERLERSMALLSAVREAQGDELGIAMTIHDLGSVASWRGALPRALRRLSDALARYEQLGRVDDVAEVRGARARILSDLGDFQAALQDEEHLQRYLEGRPRDLKWAQVLLNLGVVRMRLGDAEEACAVFKDAVTVLKKHGDARTLFVAEGNLALALRMAGRTEEALTLMRATVDPVVGRADRMALDTARNNLADLLCMVAMDALGQLSKLEDVAARKAARVKARAQLAEGETLALNAVGSAAEIGASHLACVARKTLADIYAAGGRLDKARELYELVRAESARLQAWHLQLSALQALARVSRLAGDPVSAIGHARRAAETLLASFGGMADADVARARQFVPDVFDLGVLASRDANRPQDTAYFLEAGRAMALLRGLGGRTGALRAAVPGTLSDELGAATARKLAAYSAWRKSDRGQRFDEVAKRWRAYEAARDQEGALFERVRAHQARTGATLAPTRPASLDDIVRRLQGSRQPGLRQVFLLCNVQAEDICVMQIGEDRRAKAHYIVADEAVALRTAFRTLAEAPEGKLDREALATVKRLFLDRLEIPAGPVRLIVCPDRELAYVPLSVVLPDDWELVMVPSGTTYEMLGVGNVRRGRGVLGLGDPAYGAKATGNALTTRGGHLLAPLPGTRAEIEAIAAGPHDQTLLGAQATERGLRNALTAAGPKHRWQSVHLACHGLIDLEVPAFSSLALTPGEGEDGLLTSTEILGMDLRTDLAVLSACQTGRGAYVRGEGIMSLTRAFMHAGAPRVLVSLWNVDDEATALLMTTFYREWRAGRSTAQALRRAQCAVRDHEVPVAAKAPGAKPTVTRPWADPNYWGAWTLWGLPD